MRMLTIALVIFISGCASSARNKELEALPYTAMFAQQYQVDVNSISIKFTTEFQDTLKIAICDKEDEAFDTKLIVKLDIKAWSSLSDFGKFWVIYHELGHCALNREHTQVVYPQDECPKSFMYPYYNPIETEKCYASHSAEMIQELGDNRDN